MPWYLTAYNADGSPVTDPQGSLIGSYGGEIYARSMREARVLAKRRGLNEAVCGTLTGAPRWTLPSRWLAKRRPKDSDVFHSLCWLAHLALKSGVATVDEVLGDQGLLHEYAHMRIGMAGRRQKLIAMARDIEGRIPGFIGPRGKRSR